LGKESPLQEKQNIVPIIKDSQHLEVTNGKANFATEHLCGDLWIVYAEDQPERIMTLKRDSISSIGVTEAELRALAIENLTRILPSPGCHGGGPWYLLTAGSDYVASLFLMDSIWDQLAAMVTGDIVATVPTRDVPMFTGSRSEEGLSEIRKRSTEICDTGAHAITDTLIVRRDRTWSVFNAN
jgi:uncharacterized protein YtpQ (UPF0354 family)